MQGFRTAIFALLSFGLSTSGMADWHSFWHRFHVDYHRNNEWPHPFREIDVHGTRAPFETQRLNGWQVHNTLSHELFRDGDNLLTYAGQQHIEYIVTHVPHDYRAIFVVRGTTAQETQARLAAVRQSLERLQLGDQAPPVMLVDRPPATHSGAMASAINRLWMESLQTPRLPDSEGAASSEGP